MADLGNSVIIPREDFLELQTVAFDNSHVPSFGERAGAITQTLAVFAGVAGMVTFATWGWAKANDWREKRQYERELAKRKFEIDTGSIMSDGTSPKGKANVKEQISNQ
jgi:hypothetical protein